MATFKAVVMAHHKKADGSYPVKIRVTHKRVSRWLPTNISAYPQDLTRSFTFRNKTLEYKCLDIIKQMRDCIGDLSTFVLNEHDVDWIVERIKKKSVKEKFTLDFFEFAYKFLDETKKEGTKQIYMAALHAFGYFLGVERIDINDITHGMLLDYLDWYRKKFPQFTSATASRHIAYMAQIYQKAKDQYNDEDNDLFLIPRNPFRNMPTEKHIPDGASNLGAELMQRIIDARPESPKERTALDVFILSFCLMGANMADLVEAKAFSGGTWIYNRKKTRDRRADHSEMRVEIPPQAIPYLVRLRGKGEWWLNVLHKRPFECRASFTTNRYLRKWAESNGIEPFTFYAARKTWASLARRAGVEKATIDECLVHIGSMKMADIYIERDFNLMNEANRKVLATLRWEQPSP